MDILFELEVVAGGVNPGVGEVGGCVGTGRGVVELYEFGTVEDALDRCLRASREKRPTVALLARSTTSL